MRDLLNNDVLLCSIIAWFVAQVLKTIIHAVMNKTLDFSRLVGDGGMPSAHTATVSAPVILCALKYGLGSFEFGVVMILAIIVMHDAMGVRRESGKHAQILNDLMRYLEEEPDIVLKEMLGHTPTQVVAGAVVGTITAFVFHSMVG